MARAQQLRIADEVSGDPIVEQYWHQGFAVIRRLFSKAEVAEISAAVEQLYAEGVGHGRSFRHGNLFYNVTAGAEGEPVVRMAQWPSYHQPVLNRLRLDSRIAAILEPLIGRDLKQIIN